MASVGGRSEGDQRYPAGALEKAAVDLLLAHGASPQVAQDVARSCVRASLRGLDAQGLALLPEIIRRAALQDETGGVIRRTQLTEPAHLVLGANGMMPVAIL